MALPQRRLSLIDRLLGLIEHPRISDRLILRVLFFVVVASGLWYILSLNNSFIVFTPTSGGSYTEGIVGIPRFVNPALAITRADQDIVSLVYSGLMKLDTEGNLIPDLAETIEVSEDGTTYHVVMKKDRLFQDGIPVTARDVIFTIELMRNPDLKSPLRGNWNDVVLEEINEYEFNVILQEPYAPFIENFTFGVMPAHIWNNLPIEQLPFSQYNTEPIGSGSFTIKKVIRDASGLISGYELVPSPYLADTPNLGGIVLKFYQNEDLLKTALTQEEVDATAFLSPENIATIDLNHYTVATEPLPRAFGLFINQNRSAPLRDTAARQALSKAIDREKLIRDVLGGYGVPITGPTAQLTSALESGDTELDTVHDTLLQEATRILEENGWKRDDDSIWKKKIGQETESLSVTIRTGNSPLYDGIATHVAEDWRALGVEVQVEQYEQTGLVQSVIRSRDYQILLFGLDMNRQQDLYPFWHSSQKDDPGLNISQYTNVTVDRLLEEARVDQDESSRTTTLTEAATIINTEMPAVFLFAPSMTYVHANELVITPMQRLGKPADRFMNIEKWHARTDTVWPLFQNK
jgi:peptide/nickel transport system substrate-binding protein